MYLNNVFIGENETFQLINDNHTVNKIACVSLKSKPGVNLYVFDQDFISLSNGYNYELKETCSTKQVCSKIYEINFVFEERFQNMQSLTCVAKNFQYNLTAQVTNKVNLLINNKVSSTSNNILL
jgi:hypothetical protein